MPTSANVNHPLVPPRLHVASPTAEHDADKRVRRESGVKTSSSQQHKEQGRSSSSEWVDIDEEKPRRRRKVKRSTTAASESTKKLTARTRDRRSDSYDIGRFFPKLSQILESSEPRSQPRSRQSELHPQSREENTPATHRRPIRTGASSLQSQQESLLRFNASLLSVISGLTSATDKSSGSNSTITQRSYRRRSDSVPRRSYRSYRTGNMSDVSSTASSPRRRISHQYHPEDDERDQDSYVSSSATSSQHQSEVSSSEAPETPSSRSTYPSPTSRRNSNAELKREHSERLLTPVTADILSQGSVTASDISSRPDSTYEGSTMTDDHEGFFYRDPDLVLPAETFDEDSEQPLVAPMPAHPSAFAAQYFEEMHRSPSHSSGASSRAQQALQHYYPQPMVTEHGKPLDLLQQPEDNAVDEPPPAPEAPKPGQATLAGYELLAYELASSSSSVKPMYRKFEFLNHRLLLHLQDELAELEEQLRTADEIIAHMQLENRPPASRRGDAYYGLEIHHHRTALLGRIFMKTEQYNKAMSSYSTMARDCAPAELTDVSDYKVWMSKSNPIHEHEARFLLKTDDLVTPGYIKQHNSISSRLPVALLCCSIILVLPPALFAIVPSLLGRLSIVLMVTATAVVLRFTTSMRNLLSLQDTMACTAAFLLLMSTIAFCVPRNAA